MTDQIFNASEYRENIEFDALTVGLIMESGEYVLLQQ